MTMDRRNLIKTVGATSAVALAGCSVQEESESTPTSTSSGDGSADGESSGGTPTAEPGTATIWYDVTEDEVQGRNGIIEAFNGQSQHTIEGSDVSELQDKITSAIPAGEGPTAFEWAHDWGGNVAEQGFVSDQSDNVSVSLDQFTQSARDAVQYKGSLIGLPYAQETVTLVVNTDLAEVPSTVDEMVATMDEFHDPDNGQYGIGYPVNSYFTSAFLQAFGGYFYDVEADTQLGIDSPEFVQGLEYLMQNVFPYMPEDPSYGAQASVFKSGKAPFTINGPWELSGIQNNVDNYEVVSFPEMSGGSLSPFKGIQTWYFAKKMDDGGPTADAARSFIEWFVTNEDHMVTLAEENGSVPVLQSALEADLPPVVEAYAGSANQGVPMPKGPRMGDVWSPTDSALTKAFNGSASAEEALSTAAEEIRSKWG